MISFAPVPPPSCQHGPHPATIAAEIHAWASSEPLRALVTAYGETLPEAPADTLLSWLDTFSDTHWNFRRIHGSVERDRVGPVAFDAELTGLITAAAEALHLTSAAPPAQFDYDHILVLGGLGRACLQRTEHAATLLRDGLVKAPELTALGSFRPLTADERSLPGLADAEFEIDAMEAGILRSFAPAAEVRENSAPGHWTVRTYHAPAAPALHALAAPSSEPATRRANTADTYAFWAHRSGIRRGDRILVVTSPIYIPFQHCDAIRMLALPHGCAITTTAFDPARATVPLAPGATGPDRYLQEIRSAIRSMRSLHAAVRM